MAQNETSTDAKLPVNSSALLDWNEKVIRAKRDFAIAFTKWVNSPEHKKMIEDMKRLGEVGNLTHQSRMENKSSKQGKKQALRKTDISGALLKSLHQDLKGFQEMAFLTPDVKTGLGIAIEQVERYMRNELEARQQ